jgi:hypothetical protein
MWDWLGGAVQKAWGVQRVGIWAQEGEQGCSGGAEAGQVCRESIVVRWVQDGAGEAAWRT